jgi:hypothetical protein
MTIHYLFGQEKKRKEKREKEGKNNMRNK